MSIRTFIISLTVIWCIIHGLHHYSSKGRSSILPSSSGDSRRRFWGNSKTQFTLKPLHLRLSTTRWNALYDRLSTFLRKRGQQGTGLWIRHIFDLGSLLGVVGMIVGVGGLFWMLGANISYLAQGRTSEHILGTQDAPRIARRTLSSAETVAANVHSSSLGITPIIPGVTVPISHAPLIVLAVFAAQVFHEFGHCIAGALESAPMVSIGLSFTVCLPAAFVTFPASALKGLLPRARARIISAGAFHNIFLWFLLVVIARSGLIPPLSILVGYKDVSSIGKAVVGISEDSPLRLHISLGSVVTKLDDTPLSSPGHSLDNWSALLTQPRPTLSSGWCLQKSAFGKSVTCCDESSSQINSSPHSCFVSIDGLRAGCIDPLPVLATNESKRCIGSIDCPPESECVLPHKKSQLLRITVQPPASPPEESSTILWNGPPLEVWEQVHVGNWLPRLWILPLWLPTALGLFWDYLSMATLSLYFLNLMPLPYLDGHELLGTVLDVIFVTNPPFMYDVEALEAGEDVREQVRKHARWKDRLRRFVPPVTIAGVVGYILTATIKTMY